MGRLSKKEVREINRLLGTEFTKKDAVEIKDIDGIEMLIVNGSAEFFKYKDKWVPTLKRLYRNGVGELKTITIDAGAVRFISNGADVMRPGIVDVEDGISENDFVVVKEETHKKILAIGIALFSSEAMRAMKNGKTVKNIHYVGDRIWKMYG